MRGAFEPLRPGEPIGVVALSGPVDPDAYAEGLATLRAWGHPVIEAPNLRARERLGYLAGDDEARLEGLVSVLDRGARVLVAARGGYGAVRILDRLPWKRLARAAALPVGFSDLTAVHAGALAHGLVGVHGPMVAAGLDDRESGERLYRVLTRQLAGRPLFRFREEAVVRHGRARGTAVGGNLAVLAGLVGTPFDLPPGDLVLLLEEVDEPLYRLDRWLTQLRLSGRLRDVKALIFGELQPQSGHVGVARLRRLLAEAAPGIPVVEGLPFGHGGRNLAFPVGVEVELDTWAGSLWWGV